MKKLMGEQLNHREIDEILRDVDLNGDGQVDFEGGWLVLWNQDKLSSYEHLQREAAITAQQKDCSHDEILFRKYAASNTGGKKRLMERCSSRMCW